MPSPSSDGAPKSRLALLVRLHESDPGNTALTADTVEAALNEDAPEVARTVMEHFAAKAPLTPQLLCLAGLTAMRLNAFDEAVPIFEQLVRENANDPALRFNLAWSLAMQKDFERTLEILDKGAVDALPQAAMLEVQVLHELGRVDEALAAAKTSLARHPDHHGLLAAVSVLAIDMEDKNLAADCARRAGDHPDALTTRGALALDEGHEDEAAALFARALEKNSAAPRAWIGSGLTRLLTGDHAKAASEIENGARLFKDHSGSWIAAGWAHIFAGDNAAARTAFEKALAVDANFAESHGSIAVLDAMEGKTEQAKRGAQIALRLDAHSFSGALANAMLLSANGRPEVARSIIERALRTPIDASGRTIAHVLARRGLAM